MNPCWQQPFLSDKSKIHDSHISYPWGTFTYSFDDFIFKGLSRLRFTWMRNIVKPRVILSVSKKCLWWHPKHILPYQKQCICTQIDLSIAWSKGIQKTFKNKRQKVDYFLLSIKSKLSHPVFCACHSATGLFENQRIFWTAAPCFTANEDMVAWAPSKEC